ncbi:MAG: nucleotidyltransferase domain-containing protein [Pseudomonadota bacterium]
MSTSSFSSRVKRAERLFKGEAEIVFAYIFGSAARGDAGPLSDLDFAVFMKGRRDPFAYRLKLMDTLARALGSDDFDLVVLNDSPLLLRYEVVKGGKILKDEPSTRVAFETAVVGEYLDTLYIRSVHRCFVKEQLLKGVYFG